MVDPFAPLTKEEKKIKQGWMASKTQQGHHRHILKIFRPPKQSFSRRNDQATWLRPYLKKKAILPPKTHVKRMRVE
jgi:hypothetical protein